jgi:hypothetical protein
MKKERRRKRRKLIDSQAIGIQPHKLSKGVGSVMMNQKKTKEGLFCCLELPHTSLKYIGVTYSSVRAMLAPTIFFLYIY